MENEIWKDIKNYENLYQISNLGKIKRLYKDTNHKEKILTPIINCAGHYYIGLYKNKKVKNISIRNLVASTFLQNLSNEDLINIIHKDNDKLNNSLDNLKVLSKIEKIVNVYENRIKHKNFIGVTIGKVKVLEFDRVEKYNNQRNVYYYKYECICGNIESAPKHSLSQSKKSKNTYCCSKCRKDKLSEWAKTTKVRYTDPIEGKCSILFSNYKSKCKIKNWNFNLNFDFFKKLVTSNCHYCNLEPNKCRKDNAKSRYGISRIYFNGVDRLDSSKGYEVDNVVSCCEDCNKAKRNLSYEQFLNLIKRIYEFKIRN